MGPTLPARRGLASVARVTDADPPAAEAEVALGPLGKTPAGVRRRRRAVGPEGALPGGPLDALLTEQGPPPPSTGGPAEDDARLLADVPPHHGGP